MIDHKVIWPENGVEMEITKDDESDEIQRTIQHYSDETENPEISEQAEEFERKLNEDPVFRRFVIGLSFIQRVVKVFVVGLFAIFSLAIVGHSGIEIASPDILFWALLAASIGVYILDGIFSSILFSPIRVMSIYAAGAIAFASLFVYFVVKEKAMNYSTIADYATIPASEKVLLEELMRAGKKLGP